MGTADCLFLLSASSAVNGRIFISLHTPSLSFYPCITLFHVHTPTHIHSGQFGKLLHKQWSVGMSEHACG